MAKIEYEAKEYSELKISISKLKEENSMLVTKNKELEGLLIMRDSKISQMEKLIDCFSQELESYPNIQNITKQLHGSLKICDELRVDNFQLKKKMTEECK